MSAQMQGIGIITRGRTVAVIAALFALCALAASLATGGAGAADGSRYSFDCNDRTIRTTQSGNRLTAKGWLRCTGTGGVRRQTIRVCLLQNTRNHGYVTVKCVTNARNGLGRIDAVASRRCGVGPLVGFITRMRYRIRQTDGDVLTGGDTTGANRYPRNCLG